MADGGLLKRRRISESTQLRHADYTVGWICALPCELTAAEAMLDEMHGSIPTSRDDKNVYRFGKISGHNVVMTTLPVGVYGTTSAAKVAIRMMSTFRSISIPLLVGVAGGMPNNNLRLGDVVLGVPHAGYNAVIQYDFGKMVGSGYIKPTGNLNKPDERLLTAAGVLKAHQEASKSKLPLFIQEALADHHLIEAGYAYPGSNFDIVYTSACEHTSETQECQECEPWIVLNTPRLNDNPKIHFGPIGSGNQVIKNRQVRDRLAQELGCLCFEMEAAGVMDCFPALVIRGICDYCDSSKDKIFQPYAALTAAACAKEILSLIPISAEGSLLSEQVDELGTEAVIQSLDFDEARSRLLTIKPRHPSTLQWVLEHPTYQAWLQESEFHNHNGILWIKAKPGAGKSTLMKFLLAEAEQYTNSVTISFFFLARGIELQKSTLGMYRSLLVQLFTRYPELARSLNIWKYKEKVHDLEVLSSLFRDAVLRVTRPLVCFIDALDESSEEEIRDLFENLEQITGNGNIKLFRVCVASRYYPYISVQKSLNLFLDQEDGHTDDLASYVNAKLKIGSDPVAMAIQKDVVHRSGGIFLWVILVVQILAREYDRGLKHTMREKLDGTPTELNQLIRNMLLRDKENLPGLVACIQWVLYSIVPLNIAEFYHAVLCMDKSSAPRRLIWSDEVTNEDMLRFITSASKGLLEVTRDQIPKVQLIHEAVRELMLDREYLETVYSGFSDIAPGLSHYRMAQCCFDYLSIDSFWRSANFLGLYGTPLVRYVADNLLNHLEAAERHGIPQDDFLKSLIGLDAWQKIHHARGDRGWPVIRKLVQGNLSLLVDRYFDEKLDRRENYASARVRETEILRAISNKQTGILKRLLSPAPGPSIDLKDYDLAVQSLMAPGLNRSSFLGLLRNKRTQSLAFYLLDSQDWVELQDKEWLARLVIIFATRKLDLRVSADLENNFGRIGLASPKVMEIMFVAAKKGDAWILDKLLYIGVDINAKDKLGLTALHYAVANGHHLIIERLLRVNAAVSDNLVELPTSTGVRQLLFDAIVHQAENLSAGAKELLRATDGHFSEGLARMIEELIDEALSGDISSSEIQKKTNGLVRRMINWSIREMRNKMIQDNSITPP